MLRREGRKPQLEGNRRGPSKWRVGCKEKWASKTFCCGHWLRATSEAQPLGELKVRVRFERKREPRAPAAVGLGRNG